MILRWEEQILFIPYTGSRAWRPRSDWAGPGMAWTGYRSIRRKLHA
jgi:hypothetical protein